jgi:hypothetical protein
MDVIVGNIGTVRSRVSLDEANAVFEEYVWQSKSHFGRAGHESVYILDADNGPVREYHCDCDQCTRYQQEDQY